MQQISMTKEQLLKELDRRCDQIKKHATTIEDRDKIVDLINMLDEPLEYSMIAI